MKTIERIKRVFRASEYQKNAPGDYSMNLGLCFQKIDNIFLEMDSIDTNNWSNSDYDLIKDIEIVSNNQFKITKKQPNCIIITVSERGYIINNKRVLNRMFDLNVTISDEAFMSLISEFGIKTVKIIFEN